MDDVCEDEYMPVSGNKQHGTVKSNSASRPAAQQIIGHIDMDCFYVQVERSYNESLKGKPVAVVQYNPFGDLTDSSPFEDRSLRSRYNGSLIAVSYEARALGVKRIMRGVEAKTVCPDLIMIQVPISFQKADLTIYRKAGERVVELLKQFGCVVEKASVDEVFVDLTDLVQQQFSSMDEKLLEDIAAAKEVCRIAGEDKIELTLSRKALSRGHTGTGHHNDNNAVHVRHELLAEIFGKDVAFHDMPLNDRLLLVGAVVIQRMRSRILSELGFTCSGGVAHNKMLSKIASGMHKPNQLTLVPQAIVVDLMKDMPITRVPGFGGKMGKEVASIGDGVETFGELRCPSMQQQVKAHFGDEVGGRIINIAWGIDSEQVRDRHLAKTLGCSKNFHKQSQWMPSATAFKDGSLAHWYRMLASELLARVQSDTQLHHRRPRSLVAGAAVKMMTSTSNSSSSSSSSGGAQGTSSNSNHLVQSATEYANADDEADAMGEGDVIMVGSSASEEKEPLNGLNNNTVKSASSQVQFGWNVSNNDCEHLSRIGTMKASVSSSVEGMVEAALSLLRAAIKDNPRVVEPYMIYSVALSATHFEPLPTTGNTIAKYFNTPPPTATATAPHQTTPGGHQEEATYSFAGATIQDDGKTETADESGEQPQLDKPGDGIVSWLKSSTSDRHNESTTKVTDLNTATATAASDDEIDMDVFNSLPPGIQQELKLSMRLSGKFQANNHKRCLEDSKKNSAVKHAKTNNNGILRFCVKK